MALSVTLVWSAAVQNVIIPKWTVRLSKRLPAIISWLMRVEMRLRRLLLARYR